MSFFSGTPGKWEQKSLLGPEQQGLYKQLLNAGQGRGAGGAFGQSADYYRDLLSDNSSTFNQFAAPEQRQFNEQTIPGLAEQFAGMGSGNLSSSGFRNAAVGAGADLSERLGAIRAQLRQQGAQGLAGIGQQGLGQYNENIYMPGTPGLFDTISQGIGSAIGGLGSQLGSNWLSSSNKGQSNPYGAGQASGNALGDYARRRFG